MVLASSEPQTSALASKLLLGVGAIYEVVVSSLDKRSGDLPGKDAEMWMVLHVHTRVHSLPKPGTEFSWRQSKQGRRASTIRAGGL